MVLSRQATVYIHGIIRMAFVYTNNLEVLKLTAGWKPHVVHVQLIKEATGGVASIVSSYVVQRRLRPNPLCTGLST